MSGDICLVYVTAGSFEEARKISETVVAERLAACANILGDIQAVFFWDGVVRREGEVALVLKTGRDMIDLLSARIVELHSYDEPCVVALPIIGGSSAFIDWVEAETRPLSP